MANAKPTHDELERMWRHRCATSFGTCAMCDVCGGSSTSFCECAKQRWMAQQLNDLAATVPVRNDDAVERKQKESFYQQTLRATKEAQCAMEEARRVAAAHFQKECEAEARQNWTNWSPTSLLYVKMAGIQ